MSQLFLSYPAFLLGPMTDLKDQETKCESGLIQCKMESDGYKGLEPLMFRTTQTLRRRSNQPSHVVALCQICNLLSKSVWQFSNKKDLRRSEHHHSHSLRDLSWFQKQEFYNQLIQQTVCSDLIVKYETFIEPSVLLLQYVSKDLTNILYIVLWIFETFLRIMCQDFRQNSESSKLKQGIFYLNINYYT